MNTILLQKILDILRECLAHAGNFFKDLFVSDPQEGQVIGYDSGKWKNITLPELAIDLTDEAGPDDIITFTDAADMPLKSLVANIEVEGGTNEVVITRTGKNLLDPSVYSAFLQLDGKYNGVANTVLAVRTYLGAYIGKQMIFSVYVDLTVSPAPTNVRAAANINGTTINGNNINSGNEGYTTITFTPQSVNDCIFISFGSSGGNSFTFYDIQLEAGSTRTDFEAYTGSTETITLPSSIANGYVDVISGAGMDVDTSMPFTVTPVIIKSTTGINNILADTGDVTAEYYTKTAGDIKSLVCISEDITNKVTVNTDNFSDVHVKVMKNNNVVTIYLNSATAILGGQLLTGLPAPAYNMNIIVNDGSDGSPVGATLQTQGRLNVSAAASQTVNALITYVAK